MTKEEDAIIKAIWGDEDPDMNQEDIETIVQGIISMGEIMSERFEKGRCVVYNAPTSLH